MANIHRLILLFFLSVCFPAAVFAQSAPVGAIDLAGWIKGADGTYSKAFTDASGTSSKITLNSPPNSLKTVSTAFVQSSKGLVPFDIEKTSNLDVGRVGKAVSKFAQRVGPVGMALGTVSLICELTTICKDVAGNWSISENSSLPGYPSTISTVGYYYVAGINSSPYKYPSPEVGCSRAASVDKFWGNGYTGSGSGTGANACTTTKTSDGTTNHTSITFASGTCPTNYTLSGSVCVLSGTTPQVPTSAQWDSKESLLNDSRFAPDLLDKGESLPTEVPTLTAGQKKGLGLDSVPTKDSSGNITGREDTTTEIEAVDAGTTDNPGRVIIKETKTTIKYDTNNTQISSTTNTSYTNQPADKEPSQFTVSFDSVPEATLQTYSVPNTFASTSWGSGTCPPDINVSLTGGHHLTIPTQPVCDTAVMINPFTLLLASIISVYIVAGVRGGSAT